MVWGKQGEKENMLPVTSLQKEINSLFNDFFSGWDMPVWRGSERASLGGFRPRVDIEEDERGFKVHAELPGVKKEDVKIALENGVLSISGEKQSKSEKREGKGVYSESVYGSFQRSFTLNAEVDEDKIQASFADGVLSIDLPKSERARQKAKTISIQ